ncbi:MAG: PA14 domain-containing protein [Fimbriimonadaceae bacterium]|nr:PA14 domain-containing protein [Fimbriimonadaceae bacterium]
MTWWVRVAAALTVAMIVPAVNAQTNGLLGEYFAGRQSPAGTPTLTRTDAQVNFGWGTGGPDASVGNDNFSARWSGYLTPTTSGSYRLATRSDDGARIFLDGQLIVDRWVTQGETTAYSNPISLTAGRKYELIVEYFEGYGDAAMRLLWQPPSGAETAIPSAVLTTPGPNDLPSFVRELRGGAASGKVTLWWPAVARATSYQVQRATKPAGPWTAVTAVTKPFAEHTGLTNGDPIYYRVRGRNANGYGPVSNVLALTPRTWLPYALGISTAANAYTERAWANILKNDARLWKIGTTNRANSDANGDPTEDFELFTVDGGYIQTHTPEGLESMDLRGTYRLSFLGQADLTTGHWGGTIANQQYNAATNTTTADWRVTERTPTMKIRFTATRRTASSATGTGVSMIRLMRPRTPNGTNPYPVGTVFTDEYVALHQRGSVIRMMDFSATNGNLQRTWAERQTVDRLTFYSNEQDPGYWWQGKGAPWEHAIALANATGRDLWVNVPAFADDDYARQLARFIRDRLNPNLKVYFEYSNEIWNFSFPHYGQVRDLARDAITANPNTPINFDGACVRPDGTIDEGVSVPRYWAKRTFELSEIFRQEFGAATFDQRVRPLLMTQAAWNHWIQQTLHFLDRYYGNPAYTNPPRPIASYLYGTGGSGYFHGFPDAVRNNANATVDDILNGYDAGWEENFRTMERDVHYGLAFGLKRVAYEAGPGLDDFAGINSSVQRAQRDPRMRNIYTRQVDDYFRAGGELYVHFLPVNPAHGLLPYEAIVGNQPKPKLEAFNALIAAPGRPLPVVGHRIPAEIPGGHFHVESLWNTFGTNPTRRFDQPYDWASYTVNVELPARFTVELETSGSTNGRLRLWSGPVLLGEFDAPNGGFTPRVRVPFSAGLGALRIERVNGSFTLNRIRVTRDARLDAPGGGTLSTSGK